MMFSFISLMTRDFSRSVKLLFGWVDFDQLDCFQTKFSKNTNFTDLHDGFFYVG